MMARSTNVLAAAPCTVIVVLRGRHRPVRNQRTYPVKKQGYLLPRAKLPHPYSRRQTNPATRFIEVWAGLTHTSCIFERQRSFGNENPSGDCRYESVNGAQQVTREGIRPKRHRHFYPPDFASPPPFARF